MNLLFCAISVTVFGVIGFILDVKGVKEPTVFYLLGFISAVISLRFLVPIK